MNQKTYVGKMLEKAGLTLDDVVSQLGVKRKVVNKWLNGEAEPTLREVFALCRITETSISEFLDLVPHQKYCGCWKEYPNEFDATFCAGSYDYVCTSARGQTLCVKRSAG